MIDITINYIELPATDLGATKAFYEDHLGWSFTDYGPNYAAAQVQGVEVGLNAEATVGPSQPQGSENATGPLPLLQTPDLGTAHAALADLEGVIVTPPFTYPGGRRLHFRDPSGNVLGIYESAES